MAKQTRTTTQRSALEWAFSLGYEGEPEPEDVAATTMLHRAYLSGRRIGGHEPEALDPTQVDHETLYTLTCDVPEHGFLAGDYLVVQPGYAPVIRRVITPAMAYALREHLRVCYEDEADPAPDLGAPTQTRHLTLVS